jgi:hypothetical protein
MSTRFRRIFAVAATVLLVGCGGGGGGEPEAPAESPPPPAEPPAAPQLALAAAEPLDGPDVYKSKVRYLTLGDEEAVVAVYGNRVDGSHRAWDWAGNHFAAGDVYARRSTDGGLTWGEPVNVSRTAGSSSATADHDGDPETPPIPFCGDSGKPIVYSYGAVAVAAWEDGYAGGAGPTPAQGRVRYRDAGDIEVPYRSVWVAHTTDAGATWSAPQRLTDASRDAKQVMIKGSANGFAIVWQEDPDGLQPGEGEGPGEGGSGAHVSGGTDIWYTALSTKELEAQKPWPQPFRVSDNSLTEPAALVPLDDDCGGEEPARAGASRPQVWIFGKLVVVAYEESKALSKAESGKYVRYHVFSAFDGGTSTPDTTGGAGWILSTPSENGRRVRILGQGNAGPETGMRVVFCWRQGNYDQGGPADVAARIGYQDPDDPLSTGLRPEDLDPPIDPGSHDPDVASGNPYPLNLTSRLGLQATTEADPIENARAHRGLLRGDAVLFGYVWSADGIAADTTVLDHYNFHVRRSGDGGRTWSDPYDVSRIEDKRISVREPRIVGTPPGSGRKADTAYLAWSTYLNQYEHLEQGIVDLDIFVTRTTDFGVRFESTCALADSDRPEGESQLCCTPDGERFWAVWQELPVDGGTRGVCRGGRGEPAGGGDDAGGSGPGGGGGSE